MSLEKRVGRLEDEGGGEPCSECGGPLKPGERVEIVWVDAPELPGADDPGPEHCWKCGRQLVITLTWGD